MRLMYRQLSGNEEETSFGASRIPLAPYKLQKLFTT